LLLKPLEDVGERLVDSLSAAVEVNFWGLRIFVQVRDPGEVLDL
jgi:hypothetical protein